MATKTFKIGLSNTDKQNMAQDVYERVLALTFAEYDSANTYNEGDFVVYDDTLYQCQEDNVTGAWDSTKWQAATLQDLLDDVEGAVASVNDKANVDGNYPTMTVGVADQLSPYDENSGDDQDEPFSLQATGTGNGTQPDFATGSIALMKEKQGNSVVVNQLVNKATFSATKTVNGITFTNNDDGTISVSGTATANADFTIIPYTFKLLANHKYLMFGGKANAYLRFSGAPIGLWIDNGNGVILNPTVDTTAYSCVLRVDNATVISTSIKITPILVDLTQWFNGDIPQDLLDNPSNFFRYYQGSLAYNEGTLVNADGRYIKCIGMNQWDEEWEVGSIYQGADTSSTVSLRSKSNVYYPCVPNAKYFFKHPALRSGARAYIFWYDANKNYIVQTSGTNDIHQAPSNACYFRLVVEYYIADYTTYNNDISINLYYEDEPRCLTYEPYEVLTNNDTGNEVLRSAGSVKDSKAPDGTITRRIGYVDLGSLTWEYAFSGTGHEEMRASLSEWKRPSANNVAANGICTSLQIVTASEGYAHTKEGLSKESDSNFIYVYTSTMGTDAAAFKTAMSGVYLFYELAEPTTEQGTPYSENLVTDDFGSMDFGGTNGVPQGALIFYPVDYKAFIDTLYNYTDGTPSNIALKTDIPTAPQHWAESLPGYDATKTQVLKNVEGTLTWVDEE